jgi:hypothetical protein
LFVVTNDTDRWPPRQCCQWQKLAKGDRAHSAGWLPVATAVRGPCRDAPARRPLQQSRTAEVDIRRTYRAVSAMHLAGAQLLAHKAGFACPSRLFSDRDQRHRALPQRTIRNPISSFSLTDSRASKCCTKSVSTFATFSGCTRMQAYRNAPLARRARTSEDQLPWCSFFSLVRAPRSRQPSRRKTLSTDIAATLLAGCIRESP